MSKIGFLFSIISVIVFIIASSIYFAYDEFAFAFYTIMALLIFINFLIIRKERDIFNKIVIDYSFNCDIDGYLSKIDKVEKRYFKTKAITATYDLYRARAYIDKGDFSKAKDYLLNISLYEKKLNTVATFLYLKTWNDYFYFNNEIDKMEESLLIMKKIIDKGLNKKNSQQLIQLYCVQEYKYYVINKIELDKAKDFFLKRKKFMPKVGMLIMSTEYQLGLISLIEKDYYSAYNIFKKINNFSKKNNLKDNIYLIKKAKEFEEKLKPFVDVA